MADFPSCVSFYSRSKRLASRQAEGASFRGGHGGALGGAQPSSLARLAGYRTRFGVVRAWLYIRRARYSARCAMRAKISAYFT